MPPTTSGFWWSDFIWSAVLGTALDFSFERQKKIQSGAEHCTPHVMIGGAFIWSAVLGTALDGFVLRDRKDPKRCRAPHCSENIAFSLGVGRTLSGPSLRLACPTGLPGLVPPRCQPVVLA